MKFKLFGRLREDEDGSDGSETGFSQMNESDPTGDMSIGSGLDRTVQTMFSQGYSEEDIKQELSSQYAQQDIEDAINNAVANSARGNSMSDGPSPMTPFKESQDTAVSPVDEGFGEHESQESYSLDDQEPDFEPEPAPPENGMPSNNTQTPPQGRNHNSGSVSPAVEELIETIIAENLDRVEEEIRNTYNEIDQLGQQIEDLDQRVHDLEVRDDEDQQEFVQKVDEMEEHVDQYQSRIGGLEKAFQQVLPSLVENVRDLTELVQEIKQENGIQTEKDVSSQNINDIDVEEW